VPAECNAAPLRAAEAARTYLIERRNGADQEIQQNRGSAQPKSICLFHPPINRLGSTVLVP